MKIALFTLLCLLVSVTAGHAITPRERLIQEVGQKAASAFSAGDFAEALQQYQTIEPLLQDTPSRAQELAIIRFNIGRCLDKLGRPRQALLAYLRSETPELPPQAMVRLKRRVGELRRTAVGSVRTACPQGPATVKVDALQMEPSPCGAIIPDLPVGELRLLATEEAGGITRLEVTIRPGRLTEAQILFAPIAPPSSAGAPDRTVAWALTGGAAAFTTAGLVFYGLATESNSDYEQKYGDYLRREPAARTPAQEDSILSAYDRTTSQLSTSRILLGTGGVLALASLYWWLSE